MFASTDFTLFSFPAESILRAFGARARFRLLLKLAIGCRA
jgi:hypothetical protein